MLLDVFGGFVGEEGCVGGSFGADGNGVEGFVGGENSGGDVSDDGKSLYDVDGGFGGGVSDVGGGFTDEVDKFVGGDLKFFLNGGAVEDA